MALPDHRPSDSNQSIPHSGLMRYLVAAFLARQADDGARIAFVLVAIERTGSATVGGLIVSAFLIPHVVAAPLVGSLADRTSHRSRFQAMGLVVFGVALLACGLLLGEAPLWMPVSIAVLGGCAGPLVTGGLTSLVGQLVLPSQRDRAYALDTLSYNLAGIVGPGLAAVVSGWRGAVESVWVLAGSAMAAAVLVRSLPGSAHSPASPTDDSPSPLFGQDGVALFWQNRALASATLATSLGSAAWAALPIAIVLMGERLWTPGWISIMLVGAAVGGLVGTSIYARYPFGTVRPERTCLACLGFAILPLTGLLATTSPAISLTLLAISGFWIGPMSSSTFLVRDQAAPERMKTQVFTIAAGLKMSAAAAGAAVGGLLADQGDRALVVIIIVIQVIALALGSSVLAFGGSTQTGSSNRSSTA